MSGAILVRPGRVWNASWLRLRASGERLGGVLGPSWSVFGGSWRVLASLGGFLGAFWEYFRKFLCHLEQYGKIAKNLGKSMVFH